MSSVTSMPSRAKKKSIKRALRDVRIENLNNSLPSSLSLQSEISTTKLLHSLGFLVVANAAALSFLWLISLGTPIWSQARLLAMVPMRSRSVLQMKRKFSRHELPQTVGGLAASSHESVRAVRCRLLIISFSYSCSCSQGSSCNFNSNRLHLYI